MDNVNIAFHAWVDFIKTKSVINNYMKRKLGFTYVHKFRGRDDLYLLNWAALHRESRQPVIHPAQYCTKQWTLSTMVFPLKSAVIISFFLKF